MKRRDKALLLGAAFAFAGSVYSLWLLPMKAPVQYANVFEKYTAPEIRKTSAALDDSRETLPLLSFIRIPKTGSTSMLAFLNQRNNGLSLWKHFLYSTTDFLNEIPRLEIAKASLCVYGPTAVASSVKHDHRDKRRDFQEQGITQCPHVRMSGLQHLWKASLPFWTQPYSHASGFDKASLQMFTMVREPFDRLRSLFFYVRRDCNSMETWKHKFWDFQYDLLCAGDFSGWIESLYTQEDQKCFDVPNQFPYIDNDVDEAISLIEGDSPHVIVLLNECFEASLRFMDLKFGFAPGATDAFIGSPRFTKNPRKLTNLTDDDDEESNLEKLRELSKVWFPDDYKFYNAAIAQFKRQLAAINLDPSSLKSPCEYLTEGAGDMSTISEENFFG